MADAPRPSTGAETVLVEDALGNWARGEKHISVLCAAVMCGMNSLNPDLRSWAL